MKLSGKIALVTGASRGIGKAVALKLASEGATVIVNYATSAAGAESVVKEIEANKGKAIAIKALVNDSTQVKEMFTEIESKFGGVDILVNNAGITKDGLLIRMSDEDFDNVIDTNLKGVFYCTKAAAKGMMKKRSGKIINMSSVVGFSGNAGQVNYVASKSGVMGITKSSALELATRGITVNAVAPGFIDTDMTDKLTPEQKKALEDKIPMHKVGTVADIANAVLFLASDDANYITGQVIHVNGGLYL